MLHGIQGNKGEQCCSLRANMVCQHLSGLDTDKPYQFHSEVIKRYPPGQLKKKEKAKVKEKGKDKEKKKEKVKDKK